MSTPQPTVQVLARAFALLDLLAAQREPLSLKSISERSGLHPSTAHRLLNDLAAGRLVERTPAGGWRLGLRLLELGNLVRARLDVRDAARAPMRKLQALTAQVVSLAVRQGDEVAYVERACDEPSGRRVAHAVGSRAPLHLTAAGKLFLAEDDAAALRAYAGRTGLAVHTRHSIADLAALERELARVKRSQAAHDDEELVLGVRCLAAGVFDDQARLVAGVSISAPADRLRDDWLQPLRRAAAQASAALGHRG